MNFTRIHPDSVAMTVVGNSRALKLVGTGNFAIGIMAIRVSQSNIYTSIKSGLGCIHKITGIPFCQEYRWDVSV